MKMLRDAPGLDGPPDDDGDTRQSRRAASERRADLAEFPDGDTWQPSRFKTFGEIRLPDGSLPPYRRSTHPDDYV